LRIPDPSSRGEVVPVEGFIPAAVAASVATGANVIQVPVSAMTTAMVTKAPTALRTMTSCRSLLGVEPEALLSPPTPMAAQ
jgi:hypothetical protein